MQKVSSGDELHEMSNCVYWKKGRIKFVINLLSVELVKVNKYVSQRYSGHMMMCEQKSCVPRNLTCKRKTDLTQIT